MNEQEFIFDKFCKLSERFNDKRIALYGVGQNTKYITEHLDDKDSIIGLIDEKQAGQKMYGYYVFTAEEVADKVDVIIIIARTLYLRLIYHRIKHLRNIEIYNIDGDNLHEVFSENDYSIFKNNPYWQQGEASLKLEIDKHDTISFDLFDTLLTRTIMRPTDVFELVEMAYLDNIKNKVMGGVDYSKYRIEVEHELNAITVPTFIEIYEKLGDILGLPEEEMAWLAKKEQEFEKKLLVPRTCMVELFKYASARKTVIILSDMYFCSDFLRELLEENGIHTENIPIFVSCEQRATKESGKLFKMIKQRYNNILHIGDNPKSDILSAKANGIDAYYIMSPVDMLLASPLFILASGVNTVEDSLTAGRFISRVLNSPFALCKGKGKVTIDNMDIVAEYFAPIMLNFLRWLIQAIGSIYKDAVILFLARDGYLMKQLFDVVKNNCMLDLPFSVYFLTSRDALSERYAAWHEQYNRYWDTFNLSAYKRVFVYETETKGTSIAKFGEVFKHGGDRVELICFNTFNISDTFPFPDRVHSYLGDFSFYHLPYAFLKYYELLETLSAPEQTQFLYFDNELCPVFVDKHLENRKQWEKITYIQQRVIQSLKDAITFDDMWYKRDFRAGVPDTILGMISSEFAQATDEIKSIFIFESHYENVEQTNWWDRVAT